GSGPIGRALVLHPGAHAEIVAQHNALITPTGELDLLGGTFSADPLTVNNGLIFFANSPSDLFGNLTNGPASRVLGILSGDCTFHGDVVNQPGASFIVNDSTATFVGNVTGSSAFAGNGTFVFLGTGTPGVLTA